MADTTQDTRSNTNNTQPEPTTVNNNKTHLNETAATELPSCPISFALTGLTMDMNLPAQPDDTHTQRTPHNEHPHSIEPQHETVAQPQYVSPNNSKRDVATDAHELREHIAQYKKAAMIVRCCPILDVDFNGPTPDNENPNHYYLVLRNLRSCCITTRELLLALLDRHGDPVELSFTRTGRDSFSAFLAYKTIPQLLGVAQKVPLRITRREIQTLLANSKYFPDERDMLDLVRHYCQLDRPEAFFTRNDMRLLDQ